MAGPIDIKSMASQLGNTVGVGGVNGTGAPSQSESKTNAAEFRHALDQASQQTVPGATSAAVAAQLNAMAPIGTAAAQGAASTLKFSTHAVERMKSRGISFSPETMKGIESAVGKAAQKGSKDTLILTGDSALIVSVKNNTVVTVLDKNAMKDNVFTNIDSTVMI